MQALLEEVFGTLESDGVAYSTLSGMCNSDPNLKLMFPALDMRRQMHDLTLSRVRKALAEMQDAPRD